jgi:CheY-specific phosphatase CheX
MKVDTLAIKKVLTAATFEAFEKMFYIFLEPAEQDFPDVDMEASVSFRGILNGELKLFMPLNLVQAMVRNMLNCGSGEISEKDLEDCAKEATNVICGNFLTKHESRAAFNLSIPVLQRGNLKYQDHRSGENGFLDLHFVSEYGNLGVQMNLMEG